MKEGEQQKEEESMAGTGPGLSFRAVDLERTMGKVGSGERPGSNARRLRSVRCSRDISACRRRNTSVCWRKGGKLSKKSTEGLPPSKKSNQRESHAEQYRRGEENSFLFRQHRRMRDYALLNLSWKAGERKGRTGRVSDTYRREMEGVISLA